ncbi:AMP-binding protein [Cupriavidus taiwanensis]|uniref:AMP-binding protein n=1 Tax=Cupriavidus taiwanensis TaxID=164546 RepID=UPI000E10D165|nr:AMP-binding protein [Cupriavidus taiwanensis]SOY70411.1 AMP-dependent synthetase and ligase [Cupriavidus taiwanensis]SOY72089.1 AMP-dependent synthetase and ligase [Cupriavidus taiwanensis]SOY95653.1 AMP-dependent synthetase and ligase [Cupriavidus taiwanensis]SOZ74773.1 AMP-dependent synthetase and ligase [Cupriavidus taiwanensis]SOZ88399.1 AMP-dependent synthetase and ligase [Cupriavidus taiwanensis]
MTDRTLFDLLEAAPANAVALRFEGSAITYDTLRQRALRIADGLRRHGVGRGDVVGLWLPNVPDWLGVAFACARIGASVMSLNMRYGAKEAGDFIRRARCKALVYMPAYRGKDYEALMGTVEPQSLATLALAVPLSQTATQPERASATAHPWLRLARVGLDDLAGGEPDAVAGGHAGDPCIILSSSGTTSQPKLIVHGQGPVARHAGDVAAGLAMLGSDARLLLAIPLCGAFGYTVAMSALAAQVPLTLVENFEPVETARLLLADGITHMFGTNDMLDKLLDAGGPDWKPHALRMYGHANFTPGLTALPQRAQRRGIVMRGCYGLSETLALFASQPAQAPLARREQSGGVPLAPGARVRVRSLETGESLPPGESGELELLTPDVMLGYLDDAAATAAAFTDDGYLRTGDLACLNGDGGFTHLSRIGDVLRIGGYLVNPLEIEEVVLAASGAAACQVVAVEAHGSARPVAFVVGGSGYTHAEPAVLAACKAQLAVFKVPIRVFRVDAFPVTPSPNGEKVRKNELRTMARQMLAAEETARC